MQNSTRVIRPFFDTLRELRSGKTLDELAIALRDVVEMVDNTDKAGSITLQINIKPATANSGGMMILTDKVTVKKPEFDRGGTFMYSTPDHNLQREDPNQKNLDLTVVEDEQLAIKDIDHAGQ